MHRTTSRTTLCVLLLLIGAHLSQAQFTLQTPLDNTGAGWTGTMFNVTATGGDLRITGIDCTFSPGTHLVEVWRITANHSWNGFQGNPLVWTLCGTNTITSSSATVATPLGIPLDIEIAGGDTLGLYVTTTGGVVRYTTGSNQFGIRASTADLEIQEGIGIGYPFNGAQVFGSLTAGGSSRMFNGNIHYSLGSSGKSETLVMAGTTGATGAGLIFDIRAEEFVTIEGFSLRLITKTHDLEIWTTRDGGPASSAIGNMSAWQRVGEVTNFTNSISSTFDPGFNLNVPIAPGQQRGFYITQTDAGLNSFILTQAGTTPGEVSATDGTLSVEVGDTCDYFQTNVSVDGTGSIPATVNYRRNLGADLPNNSNQISSLSTMNGPNLGEGLMFDAAAVGGTFSQITKIDAYFHTTGTYDMELWAVRDRTSHIGKETNQAAWELIKTQTVNATTTTGYTTAFNNLRTVLEPGTVQGLYITTTDGINVLSYSSGTNQGNVFASNAWIELRAGLRLDYPFLPTAFVNRQPDVRVWSTRSTSTLPGLAENFSGGNGIFAPPGWLTHVSIIADPTEDGWNFSNPQPIFPAPLPPIDSKFAAVDSDNTGFGNQDDASLYSPAFDASTGSQTLSFDHYHRPLASTIMVDIWDGSGWNSLINTTNGTSNPQKEVIDITSAAGGASQARLRFRYQGAFDWHWAVDNVRVTPAVGDGQAPRPGLAVLDVNFASEANGQPVASNLPGAYFADGYTSNPIVFYLEGEPNQPLFLLQGPLNPNNFAFTQPFDIGKLDIGSFNPMTAQFQNVEVLGDGTAPGFINSLFFTNGTGSRSLSFTLPPFTAGSTFGFQSVMLSSFINAAFTNAVELDVIN